jgi:hypothetical protein
METTRRVEVKLHEIDHGDRWSIQCRTKSRSGSMRSAMETCLGSWCSCYLVEVGLHEIGHGDVYVAIER